MDMKNQVVFTVNKNGSVNVKVDNSLFEEEFKKIQALYGLDDMCIDLFKSDGMIFMLSNAIQAWISGFDCEAKNDYYLVMDYSKVSDYRYGDIRPVYHVKDGKSIYEEKEGYIDEKAVTDECNEEVVGEDRTDID